MATTNAPWKAAHAGVLGQADAIEGSARLNQLLGTHPNTEIYQGNSIVTPNGQAGSAWALAFDTLDIDQPFTMSGTSMARVAIPILPVGNGADLIVSLCNDNAGNPGTVITRTRIPASWINQLSAVSAISAPSSSTALVQYTGNPLAASQYNTLHMGFPLLINWSAPANGLGGPASFPVSTYFGNYFIQIGGNNGSTFFNNVYTIGYDNAGNLAQAVPQPALPVTSDGTGSAVVQQDPSSGATTLIMSGGSQVSGSGQVTSVFAAGFNPSTGVIDSWSTQTALPVANQYQSTVAWKGYVYTLGGSTSGGVTANVYYAQVQNGQVGSWTATAPLPAPLWAFYAVACNGFIFAIGGENPGAVTQSSVYYAPINSDGTLGTWQNGPSLPVTEFVLQGQQAIQASSYGIALNGNSRILTLGVTADGPDVAWQSASLGVGGNFFAIATGSAGRFQYYGLGSTSYTTMPLTLTPRISVPLPATGLTNSTTYHILMQQPNGDPADYLRTFIDLNALPGNPTLRTSPKNGWTWTANASAGNAVPIQIFDNSNSNTGANGATGNNVVWHSWDDSGARITALVRATTPDQRLIGVCEATVSPVQLNANSGFESGVSPWTASNGTVTQSNVQAFEGSFSLLLTPTGGFTTAAALSEKVPCVAGVNYTIPAKAYSPGGYSNVNTQVNWYTAGGSFISSSTTVFNVAAATWTDITTSFAAPATAYQAQIVLQEAGSPTSGNTIYFDNAWIYETSGGPQVSSVTQVNYQGTWPGSGLWPPTGTTELA